MLNRHIEMTQAAVDALHAELRPGAAMGRVCFVAVALPAWARGDHRRDEILGLVRAFLVASSRRVLANRRVIRDQPTARLMTRFYSELVAGVAPLEAFRRAQLELLGDSATSDPADWAAFILVGDPASWVSNPQP